MALNRPSSELDLLRQSVRQLFEIIDKFPPERILSKEEWIAFLNAKLEHKDESAATYVIDLIEEVTNKIQKAYSESMNAVTEKYQSFSPDNLLTFIIELVPADYDINKLESIFKKIEKLLDIIGDSKYRFGEMDCMIVNYLQVLRYILQEKEKLGVKNLQEIEPGKDEKNIKLALEHLAEIESKSETASRYDIGYTEPKYQQLYQQINDLVNYPLVAKKGSVVNLKSNFTAITDANFHETKQTKYLLLLLAVVNTMDDAQKTNTWKLNIFSPKKMDMGKDINKILENTILNNDQIRHDLYLSRSYQPFMLAKKRKEFLLDAIVEIINTLSLQCVTTQGKQLLSTLLADLPKMKQAEFRDDILKKLKDQGLGGIVLSGSSYK